MVRLSASFIALIAALGANASTVNQCIDSKGKVTMTEASCEQLGLRYKTSNYYEAQSEEDKVRAAREGQLLREKGRLLDQKRVQEKAAQPATTSQLINTDTKQSSTVKKQECDYIDANIANIAARQLINSTPYLTEQKQLWQDRRFEKRCHLPN
ncbi:MAG: hypothetical protein KJ958_15870 [Gammaproteobacteria bacterium]|nr:hypothetical protein [Gammaproteobacteria bacterium]MBU1980634.1 hypothetical protein [Gammaproteobacteria bacterium]